MRTKEYMQQGFTLIELMIVVAVVAILAVIAYPSYDEYIRRSRMEDARAAVIENIQVMERHYGRKNTFCAAVKNDGSCAAFPLLPAEETRFYRLGIEAGLSSADNFVLSAVPKDGVYSDEKQANNALAIYYSSLNGSFFKCKKGADFDNDVGCENF